MKNTKFPLIALAITFFLSTGVTGVSARAEVPEGLRKNDAATSGLRPVDPAEIRKDMEIEVEYEGGEEQPGFAPTVMALPDQVEPAMMREGMPARVESQLPLQVQERVNQRNQEREQREEQLREMNRSQRAEERMSDVAKSVQELLASSERQGGIGQDIRDIAQEHQSNQEKLDQDLVDVNSRVGLTKFLWGANKASLNSVEAEASQIDARITRLKALQDTVIDDSDAEILSNLIEDLEGQRNDLLETVEAEGSNQGVFGWMRRLFGQR